MIRKKVYKFKIYSKYYFANFLKTKIIFIKAKNRKPFPQQGMV